MSTRIEAIQNNISDGSILGTIKEILGLLNERVEEILIMLVFTGVITIIGLELIRRFVFATTTDWGIRMAMYGYVFLSWIGASYAVRKRIHLRIDFIQNRFPDRIRLGIQVFGNLMFAGLVIALTFYAIRVVQVQYETGRTMFGVHAIKTWYLYGTVPPALALIVIRLVQNTIEDIQIYRRTGEFVESEPLFVDSPGEND